MKKHLPHNFTLLLFNLMALTSNYILHKEQKLKQLIDTLGQATETLKNLNFDDLSADQAVSVLYDFSRLTGALETVFEYLFDMLTDTDRKILKQFYDRFCQELERLSEQIEQLASANYIASHSVLAEDWDSPEDERWNNL